MDMPHLKQTVKKPTLMSLPIIPNDTLFIRCYSYNVFTLDAYHARVIKTKGLSAV